MKDVVAIAPLPVNVAISPGFSLDVFPDVCDGCSVASSLGEDTQGDEIFGLLETALEPGLDTKLSQPGLDGNDPPPNHDGRLFPGLRNQTDCQDD